MIGDITDFLISFLMEILIICYIGFQVTLYCVETLIFKSPAAPRLVDTAVNNAPNHPQIPRADSPKTSVIDDSPDSESSYSPCSLFLSVGTIAPPNSPENSPVKQRELKRY